MSASDGAPHLELNTPDYPNLDPSAPSNRSSTNVNGPTGSSGNSTMANMRDGAMNMRDGAMNSAQSTMDSIRNHPATQNVKNTFTQGEIDNFDNRSGLVLIVTGPVAENMRNQAAKTQDEFSALANARQKPDQQTATGQELTHYHSMFYSLLSWENPRATALTYLATILSIFLFRYFPIVRYFFKIASYILGVTAGAELVGKLIFSRGFVSQMRPRKYYVVPRESLDRMTEDLEQLINFFVIEFQRTVFVENVYATIAAFLASFTSYWLVKFVPLWGLFLIGTTVVYFAPLIYIQNKDTIDAQLNHASEVISQQTHQIKDMTAQRAQQATQVAQKYAHEYSAKAQEYMGSASRRASSAGTGQRSTSSAHHEAGQPGSQPIDSITSGRSASSTHQSQASGFQPTDSIASGRSTSSTHQPQESGIQPSDPIGSGRNPTAPIHQSYEPQVRSGDPLLSQSNFPNAPTSEPAPLHQSYESQVRNQDPLLNA